MGWKIYSWILAGCLAIAYYDIFSESAKVPDFIDIPISLVALVGLLGYAYKKRIGKRQFWQFWLLLLIAWDILYNFFLKTYPDISTAWLAAGYLLFLPEYIALYKYSRHFEWSEEPSSNQADTPA